MLEQDKDTVAHLFDKNLKIVAVIGEKTLLLLGYKIESIVGKSIQKAYNTPNSLQYSAQYAPFWTYAIKGIEQSFLSEHHGVFWRQSFYALRDENGKIMFGVTTSKNVTDTTNKSIRLEGLNERIIDIAYINSHTLRSPLARIIGLVNAIESNDIRDDKDKKEVKELIRHLSISAKQLDEVFTSVDKLTEIDEIIKENYAKNQDKSTENQEKDSENKANPEKDIQQGI